MGREPNQNYHNFFNQQITHEDHIYHEYSFSLIDFSSRVQFFQETY